MENWLKNLIHGEDHEIKAAGAGRQGGIVEIPKNGRGEDDKRFTQETLVLPKAREAIPQQLPDNIVVYSSFVSTEQKAIIRKRAKNSQDLTLSPSLRAANAQAATSEINLAKEEREELRGKLRGGYSEAKDSENPDANEDVFFASEKVIAVMDGLGRHSQGSRAAQETRAKIEEADSDWTIEISPEDAIAEMKNLYEQLMDQRSGESNSGLTTISLSRLVTYKDEKYRIDFCVGDSPLYEYTGGSLVKLNKAKGFEDNLGLTEEEKEVFVKMAEECRGLFIQDPANAENKIVDFQSPAYDKVPAQYRTVAWLQRMRSNVTDAIGDRSGKAILRQEPYISYTKITGKNSLVLAVSDGVTKILTPDELKNSIQKANEKFPNDRVEMSRSIIADTNKRRAEIKKLEQEVGLTDKEYSFAGADDETCVISDFKTPQELLATELLSDAGSISSLDDFKMILSQLGDYHLSTAQSAEAGETVRMTAATVIERIKMMEHVFTDSTKLEEFMHFVAEKKGEDLLMTKEKLIGIVSSYLNSVIKRIPREHSVRSTAARLFVEQYLLDKITAK